MNMPTTMEIKINLLSITQHMHRVHSLFTHQKKALRDIFLYTPQEIA